MPGAIIGDIIPSMSGIISKQKTFHCSCTDDTAMTIAVAEDLMAGAETIGK